MEIQIDPHTLQRANERGTDENEIKDVLLNGISGDAKGSRKMKWKVYSFKANRQKKYFEQKKVEVYYSEEGDKLITVTVYVFYGKWEE